METWNQMSSDAVRTHTPTPVNRRIDAHVEACVRSMAERGDRVAMSQYLTKLEREWDLNRAVSVGASALAVLGLMLGRQDGGRWRVLSGVAAGLLLQHGLLGFGPLAAVMRALGVRTRREIDLEKFALKALRGDFERIPSDGGPLARANAALVAAQS
ncbi:hypothetical protein DRW03_02020 [Corallococcus sp. H22C18031201]|uniref:hypothetical protein n=1 Tax=Citreicoccus inhibens TaxID=2849499 RepID=UPI000E711CE3|nr:hypothetical protein [Citreicoccus inhibens]MBU8895021.1 hypothetical protein [Citreicoccus inhibens]RJS27563.1 hypothetical protein DRW03_02020 [Corallococcus sp. H22C18031201]